MRYCLLMFVASLTSVLSAVDAPSGAVDCPIQLTVQFIPGCYNKKLCIWSKCGSEIARMTIDSDGNCPSSPPSPLAQTPSNPPAAGTPGHSTVNNLDLRYRHYAADYSVSHDGGSGCRSCGGSSPMNPEVMLPELSILRTWTPDTSYQTSFGYQWGWNGDIWMRLYPPGQIPNYISHQNDGWVIEVSQPYQEPIDAFASTDPDHDGIFTDADKAFSRDIRLYDASGALVSDPALAVIGVLTSNTGETFTFEVYDENPGSGGLRTGRILRFADRNGQAMTWSWKYALDDPALVGSLRTKLVILDHVTDAYGRTATFHFDETHQHDGYWVVSRIDLPNGQHLSYEYAPAITTIDAALIDGLAAVRHPDGSSSTFTTRIDPVTACLQWHCEDMAAEPLSRVKTNLMTELPWIDPADPTHVYFQIFGRLRESRNGEGEQTYASVIREYPDGVGGVRSASYIFADGQVQGLEHRQGDKPTAVYQRDDVSGDPATWLTADWSGWTRIGTYAYDTGRDGVSRFVDANGHETRLDRDPHTNAVTRAVFPDGSQFVATYNEFRQPLHYVDRVGRIIDQTYDVHGNMLTKTVAVGTSEQAMWSWSYDARGLVTASTDANGNDTQYQYTPEGYLAAVIEPGDRPGDAPATTQYQYDTAGRRTAMIDASGRLMTSTYDARNRLIDIGYADASHEAFAYGAPGSGDENLMVAKTDRDGNRTTYQYDRAGRKIGETTADGTAVAVTTTWSYRSGTSKPLSETRAGDLTEYRYDARMRLAATTHHTHGAAALTDTVAYDPADHVIAQADAYGRRIFLVRDVNDRVVRTLRELVPGGLPDGVDPAIAARDPNPNPAYIIDEMGYDALGEMIAKRDGRNLLSTMTFDSQGRVTEQVLATGTADEARMQMGYDPQGNVIIQLDPRQVLDATLGVTAQTWTARNLLASRTEADGTAVAATTSSSYTPTKKIATRTDALARTTTYQYGTCCDRLVGIIDPSGALTTLSYDPFGNRISMTDPNGLTTAMGYDARNRMASSTNAAGETTTMVYDDALGDGAGLDLDSTVAAAVVATGLGAGADGSAVATTDALGETTVQVLDGLGRRVAMIDPLAHTRLTTYDVVAADGLVETTMRDALGHATISAVDAAGRARRSADAQGAVTRRAFDANGNQVSARDPNGIGSDRLYDARDRMVRDTDTAGRVMLTAYDVDGDVISLTDALGAVTTSLFDARDRKVTTTDRIAATTSFAYDLVSNLVRITDAEGGVTSYGYDVRDLLVRETFPGLTGGTRTYGYDPGRRLARRLDQAFILTTYQYDPANRQIRRAYTDGSPADQFAYDHVGRLIQADAGRYADRVTRHYDAASRLTEERLIVDGLEFPVGSAYDAADRLTGLTYPSGNAVTRAYTDRDQLAELGFAGASVVHRDYDLGARLVSTAYGNGLHETRGYLPGDNLVATISTPGVATASDPSPAPVTSFTYAYDQDRRKTAEIDAALPPGNDQRFAYDAEGRLIDWRRGAASFQTWTLTPVGDWRQTVRDGVVENRTHTPVHEIRAIDGLPVLSDAKGNLSLQLVPLQLYTWDSENRLVSAAGLTPGFGAYIARYRYDALGRRIQKTVNGQTTTWISAGAQEIVEITGDPRHVPWLDPHPDLSPAVPPGLGPQGSLLQLPGSLHIDFRPSTGGAIPGWLIDTGDPVAWHTPTLRYGWDRFRAAVDRGYLDQPIWDSFVRMMAPLPTRGAWSIALANGSYPVVIVMGDAISRNQTNTIAVNGQVISDPTPAQAGPDGYVLGAFDGYTIQATVTAGTLTIAAAPGAKDPKLCFVEIGPRGGALDASIRDRVAHVAQTMTDATATERGKAAVAQEKVFGTYVDEPLALVDGGGTKSYVHANHLYSVEALTNTSGSVVERYRYNAYGERIVLDASGAAIGGTAHGNQLGFSGRYHEDETGLTYFRTRFESPTLGRFLNRMPWNQWSDSFQKGVANNMAMLVVPDELLNWHMAALVNAHGSYIQDRYNLYDAFKDAPSRYLEPFSTCKDGTARNDGSWNNPSYQSYNNCYDYARNKKSNQFLQPGDLSGGAPAVTCADMIKAAKTDGAVDFNGQCCPQGYHRVYLVVDPGKDFHWYRRDEDGKWSHKRGGDPAGGLDASGNPILDPAKADKKYPNSDPAKSLDYQDCGYLCLPN